MAAPPLVQPDRSGVRLQLVGKHHILLQGTPHSLFLDENRGQFTCLMFEDKVDWIQARVQLVLMDPCRAALKEAETNYLGLVIATALCAGISAAGSFMHRKQTKWRGENVTDAVQFKRFVRKYMVGPRGQMSKGVWADWLYKKVRCGLAHGFTIEEGGIDIALEEYVHRCPDGAKMNPLYLLDDLEAAWLGLLDDVRTRGSDPALGQRFLDRFDGIYRD